MSDLYEDTSERCYNCAHFDREEIDSCDEVFCSERLSMVHMEGFCSCFEYREQD